MNYYPKRGNRPPQHTCARAPADSGRAHAYYPESASARPSIRNGRLLQDGSPANQYQYQYAQPMPLKAQRTPMNIGNTQGYYQNGCWYNTRLQRQTLPRVMGQASPQPQQQRQPRTASYPPAQQEQEQGHLPQYYIAAQSQQQQNPITASYPAEHQHPSYPSYASYPAYPSYPPQQQQPIIASYPPPQQQHQQLPITATYPPQQLQQLPSYYIQPEQQVLPQSYQSQQQQQVLSQPQVVMPSGYPSQQPQYVLVPTVPSQHQQQQFILQPYPYQQDQGQSWPQTYESPSCSSQQLQQQQQQDTPPSQPTQGQPTGQYREADTTSWGSLDGGSSVYPEEGVGAATMTGETQNPTEAVMFTLAPGVQATRSGTKLTIDIDLSQVEDAVPEARLKTDELMSELSHLISGSAFRRRRNRFCLQTTVPSPSPVSDGLQGVFGEDKDDDDAHSADNFESLEESSFSSLNVSVAEKNTQTFEIFKADEEVPGHSLSADAFESVPESPTSCVSVLMADKDTQTDEVFQSDEVCSSPMEAPSADVSESVMVSPSSSRCVLVSETVTQTDEGEALPSAAAESVQESPSFIQHALVTDNDAATTLEIFEANEEVPSQMNELPAKAPDPVQESPLSNQTTVEQELPGPQPASSLTPTKQQEEFLAFQSASLPTPTQEELLSEHSVSSSTLTLLQEQLVCLKPTTSTMTMIPEEHLTPQSVASSPRILLQEKHLQKTQPVALANYLIGNQPSKGKSKKRNKAKRKATGLDTSKSPNISPRRDPKGDSRAPLPIPEPSEPIGDSSSWPPLGTRAPTKASQVKKTTSINTMTVFSSTWKQVNANSARNSAPNSAPNTTPRTPRGNSSDSTFQPKQILRREDSAKSSKGVKSEAGAPKVPAAYSQVTKAPPNRPLSSANDKKTRNSRQRDMTNPNQPDRKNSFQSHKQKQPDSKLIPGNMFALLDEQGAELPLPAIKAKAAGKEADLEEVRKLAAQEAKKQKRYLKKKNARAVRLENKEKAVAQAAATKKEKAIAAVPERRVITSTIICGPKRKTIGMQVMGELKLATLPAINRRDKTLKLLFFQNSAPQDIVGDASIEANKPLQIMDAGIPGDMDEVASLDSRKKGIRSNFLDAVAEFAFTLKGGGSPREEKKEDQEKEKENGKEKENEQEKEKEKENANANANANENEKENENENKEEPPKRNIWEQRKQPKT